MKNNWLTVKNNVLVKCSEKAQGHVVIPDYVTEIGEYTFYGCTGLTSIEIPETVTKIGFCAFCRCKRMKNVIIPESMKKIRKRIFSGCILKNVMS